MSEMNTQYGVKVEFPDAYAVWAVIAQCSPTKSSTRAGNCILWGTNSEIIVDADANSVRLLFRASIGGDLIRDERTFTRLELASDKRGGPNCVWAAVAGWELLYVQDRRGVTGMRVDELSPDIPYVNWKWPDWEFMNGT